MDIMLTKILETINRHRLIRTGDAVLAGVSGGPDSVALLAVLHELRHQIGIRALSVLHVNHQLRRGAQADQKFVEQLCARWQIPCVTVLVKLKTRVALEDQARDLRYAALIREAVRVKADCIALGHHRDDVVETVLMRLVRGTGLLGLQGILPCRLLQGIRLIRPVIDVSRDDILTFLRRRKMSFREDPTNAQTKFLRNRVRHELLPLLEKKYNPQIRVHLAHLAETAGADYDFLSGEAQRAFRQAALSQGRATVVLSLARLAGLHPALRRLVLRLAVQALQGDLNRLTLAHISELEDLVQSRPDGALVNLPVGISARLQAKTLIFRRRKA